MALSATGFGGRQSGKLQENTKFPPPPWSTSSPLEMQNRHPFGRPRVSGIVGPLNLPHKAAAQIAEARDIQPEVHRGKSPNVSDPHRKQACGRAKPPPVFRVTRAGVLFFQVNERAGNLDQTFVKIPVCISAAQPKMLQDIMRFVIIPRIETPEISQVIRRKSPGVIGVRGTKKSLDAFAFSHFADWRIPTTFTNARIAKKPPCWQNQTVGPIAWRDLIKVMACPAGGSG